MKMIAKLFVLVCACALGLADDDAPPYKAYQEALEQVLETLDKHVLAMDGAVPLLDDYRRHFTQIINVINLGGLARSGCEVNDYDEEYSEIVNHTLAQGLAYPQAVVNDIKELIERVRNETEEIVHLVKTVVADKEHANRVIADQIKQNDDLKLNDAIYQAAGEAAQSLLLSELILSVTSHQFTTTSLAVRDKNKILKDVIEKTANLYRQLSYKDRIPC